MNIHALILSRFVATEDDFNEWLIHHLSLGFSHVHVFDNGVPFDLRKACSCYSKELVSYEKVEGPICQYDLYDKYIKAHKPDYVMPIDDDEYLWLAPEFKTIGDLLEHYGNPDCFGIRWKFLFPKNFSDPRVGRVLDYCTVQNDFVTAHFFWNGEQYIKCVVKCKEYVRWIDAKEGFSRNHIPVTRSDAGALLSNGTRTNRQRVENLHNEPVRLIHCPYKGYDEFIKTRGQARLSVCRRQPRVRHAPLKFLKWLEAEHERQTA